MRNKKTTFRKAITLIGIMTFVICSARYAISVESEKAIDDIIVNPSPQTVIEIYTYGGEYYRAIGSLNVINNEKDKTGFILELNGNLEKIKLHKKNTTDYPLSETSVVLNVYEGDSIYGFYSNKKMEINRNEKMTNIVMYGYLEAYYDGSYNYSG